LTLLSIFSCRDAQEISFKKYKKSTRGVYFTILAASPCAAEFYEIWHTRSSHGRNHVCHFPLTCCVAHTTVRTTVLHCETAHSLSTFVQADALKQQKLICF